MEKVKGSEYFLNAPYPIPGMLLGQCTVGKELPAHLNFSIVSLVNYQCVRACVCMYV